jgi:hypothetical protein
MNRLQHFIKYACYDFLDVVDLFLSSSVESKCWLDRFVKFFSRSWRIFYVYYFGITIIEVVNLGYQDWSKQKANLRA